MAAKKQIDVQSEKSNSMGVSNVKADVLHRSVGPMCHRDTAACDAGLPEPNVTVCVWGKEEDQNGGLAENDWHDVNQTTSRLSSINDGAGIHGLWKTL